MNLPNHLLELTSCGRMRNILRVDMFTCLVSLCLSLPTLYMHSSAQESVDVEEDNKASTSSGEGCASSCGNKKDIKILATPSGRVNESNVLKFILGLHIVQIMISVSEESDCIKDSHKTDQINDEILSSVIDADDVEGIDDDACQQDMEDIAVKETGILSL